MNSSFRWTKNLRIIWTTLLAFAVFSAMLPANAALIEGKLSGGQVVSEQASDHETLRQSFEREMVARKLADYGFSQQEVQLMLLTTDDAQLQQFASSASKQAKSGNGRRLVATLMIIVLLVIASSKLSESFQGSARFNPAHLHPGGAQRGALVGQRADPVSYKALSKPTRPRKGRVRRKPPSPRSGKMRVHAADQRHAPPEGE